MPGSVPRRNISRVHEVERVGAEDRAREKDSDETLAHPGVCRAAMVTKLSRRQTFCVWSAGNGSKRLGNMQSTVIVKPL
jgi:hypothetical protein